MAKKKKYTVMVATMITPEILTKLEEITDEMEVSKSEFIREIIEEKLNHGNFKEINEEKEKTNGSVEY
ncbi:MAG: ribbon-helix-helix protein, CopG family [Desulfobacula sp.]|nr:ribbon-helix-helix protein, CopG family [Desulfobacula sp.]